MSLYDRHSNPLGQVPFFLSKKVFFGKKRFLLPKQSLDSAQNFIYLTQNQQIMKMPAILNKAEKLFFDKNEQKFNLWLMKYFFV